MGKIGKIKLSISSRLKYSAVKVSLGTQSSLSLFYIVLVRSAKRPLWFLNTPIQNRGQKRNTILPVNHNRGEKFVIDAAYWRLMLFLYEHPRWALIAGIHERRNDRSLLREFRGSSCFHIGPRFPFMKSLHSTYSERHYCRPMVTFRLTRDTAVIHHPRRYAPLPNANWFPTNKPRFKAGIYMVFSPV